MAGWVCLMLLLTLVTPATALDIGISGTGVVPTALALQANGDNCVPSQKAGGVSAQGAAEQCGPQVLNAGTGSPLAIDSDAYDQVHIADLAGATTISIPTGTPVNGQLLLLSFYTAAKVDLTWTSGGTGFSSENGVVLPPSTLASAYLEVLLPRNALASRCA